MSIPAEPPALSPEQLEAWASLATLMERLPAALDAQLQRDSGVTHFEHGIMYALDNAPDRTLRMSTLAGYASSSLSRLSRAVTRLEAKGFLRRNVDPTDGRFTLAVLTEKGHSVVAQSTPGHHALVRQLVIAPLTDRQLMQLGVLSRKIAETLDPAPSWRPQPSSVAPRNQHDAP